MSISLLLMIVSLVMFILATANIPAPARFNWLPAGLMFWVLSILIASVGIHA